MVITGWALDEIEAPKSNPIGTRRLNLLKEYPECWVCKEKLNEGNSCCKRKILGNARVLVCKKCAGHTKRLESLGLRNHKGNGTKKKKQGSSRKRRFRKWAENSHCAYCGLDIVLFSESTEDHVVPLGFGGSKGVDNIVLACKPCNKEKALFSREEFENSEWLVERKKQVGAR